MVKKQSGKKRSDYFSAVNRRRIYATAPSEELKKEFENIAAELDRTPTNLAWHLIHEFMRDYRKQKEERKAA